MTGPGHIAAIVLAAGRSTRMGAANKLLADIGGRPIVRHTVEAALASHAWPVLVVTGHQADEVRTALADLDVAFLANPDFAIGLSSSLKVGVRALPPEADGALVLLGDMPRIEAAHLDAMIAAFTSEAGKTIVVPVHEGQRGNPVLWPSDLLAEMLALDGDVGARSLMATHARRVREIDLGTDAILMDVDTPEALARLRGDAGRSD
jgi:molybdenum cofactor cytidylyltransferase